MVFEHFQIYLNWPFFNFWDNFIRYWGTGILIRVEINFCVVYREKNEMNVGTEWAYQLGVWGIEGGAGSPLRWFGSQSQKILIFCILMTSKGPNCDRSGVKYDLLKDFLKPNLRIDWLMM